MKYLQAILILCLFSSCSMIPAISPKVLLALQAKQAKITFEQDKNTTTNTFTLKVLGDGYIRFLSKSDKKNHFLQNVELMFNEKGQAVLQSNPDLSIQPVIQATLTEEAPSPALDKLKICSNGKILYKQKDTFEFISILSILVFPDSVGENHEQAYKDRSFVESRPITESSDKDCEDET